MYSKQESKKELYTDKVVSLFIFPRYSGSCPVILQFLSILKQIEELRRYKKLFQENLYNSMKMAKNHKDCKRELVLLKRNFLDKEKIDNVEKPFESNHELQREFLEKNVDHYKGKINTMNKIFVNDHSKVMKEKRQLISIENQLEKERREIQEADTYKSEKVSGITKPKGKLKSDVPRFPHPK